MEQLDLDPGAATRSDLVNGFRLLTDQFLKTEFVSFFKELGSTTYSHARVPRVGASGWHWGSMSACRWHNTVSSLAPLRRVGQRPFYP